MASKEYAALRAGELGESAGRYEHRIPDGDTTAYVAVVDEYGNGVSFINSNYSRFGSGLTVGGFVLQNRGRSFSLNPDHANCLAPRKRPSHTIIPAMLRNGSRFAGAFGVIGGPMQPQGHLQLLANLVVSDLNPQGHWTLPASGTSMGTRSHSRRLASPGAPSRPSANAVTTSSTRTSTSGSVTATGAAANSSPSTRT